MGCSRLLLIDDSEDDAHLFQRAVERTGLTIQVEWASSASVARFLILRSLPALVVLDNDMPETDGIDLLQEIRSKTAQERIPVVMMSGTESDEVVRLAYDHGVNSFVRKPDSYKEYLACVQSLVEYWFGTNCRAIVDDPLAPAASAAVGRCD